MSEAEGSVFFFSLDKEKIYSFPSALLADIGIFNTLIRSVFDAWIM